MLIAGFRPVETRDRLLPIAPRGLLVAGHRRAGRLPHRLRRDRGQGDRRRPGRRDRRRPARRRRRGLRPRGLVGHADPRRRLRPGQLPRLRPVRAGLPVERAAGTRSRRPAPRRSASSCSPRWRCSRSGGGCGPGRRGPPSASRWPTPGSPTRSRCTRSARASTTRWWRCWSSAACSWSPRRRLEERSPALAGLTKFGPLILAPLFAAGHGERRPRAADPLHARLPRHGGGGDDPAAPRRRVPRAL